MLPEPALESLFITRLYRAQIDAGLIGALGEAAQAIALDDAAGQRWCARHGYPGYTSYASLDDLTWRDGAFARLVKLLDRHAAAFAKAAEWDLGRRRLRCDSLWINILEPGGFHSGHIHPHSVISGTVYVAMPDGAAALKLEDPRLALMMAAPTPRRRAARANQRFVSAPASPGTLLLWESWLRHEVPLNQADSARISISFNYAWG